MSKVIIVEDDKKKICSLYKEHVSPLNISKQIINQYTGKPCSRKAIISVLKEEGLLVDKGTHVDEEGIVSLFLDGYSIDEICSHPCSKNKWSGKHLYPSRVRKILEKHGYRYKTNSVELLPNAEEEIISRLNNYEQIKSILSLPCCINLVTGKPVSLKFFRRKFKEYIKTFSIDWTYLKSLLNDKSLEEIYSMDCLVNPFTNKRVDFTFFKRNMGFTDINPKFSSDNVDKEKIRSLFSSGMSIWDIMDSEHSIDSISGVKASYSSIYTIVRDLIDVKPLNVDVDLLRKMYIDDYMSIGEIVQSNVFINPNINKSITANILVKYLGEDYNPFRPKVLVNDEDEVKRLYIVEKKSLSYISKQECAMNKKTGDMVGMETLVNIIGEENIRSKAEAMSFGGNRSTQEDMVCSILDKLEIDYIVNDRTTIENVELDIVIPSYRLAIEVNGVYWHSTFFDDRNPVNRHINKYVICRDSGIVLLQLTDWEVNNRLSQVEDYIYRILNVFEHEILLDDTFSLKNINYDEYHSFCEKHSITIPFEDDSYSYYSIVDDENNAIVCFREKESTVNNIVLLSGVNVKGLEEYLSSKFSYVVYDNRFHSFTSYTDILPPEYLYWSSHREKPKLTYTTSTKNKVFDAGYTVRSLND